jgi:glutamate carboxypeptidase
MPLPQFVTDIADRSDLMMKTLQKWAHINSSSDNLTGLEEMGACLAKAFEETGGTVSVLPSKPMPVILQNGAEAVQKIGPIIQIVKRPTANKRILLCGHMDTVFPTTSPFQFCKFQPDGRLNGPGVADMKGGILVMLNALLAFEKSDEASQIGWEVLINSDEEIGSFGSAHQLAESGNRAHVGLLFEPSLADGTLAGARKGSGNFTVTAEGKAAHAGRDHHLGRNAIAALAKVITQLDQLTGGREGLTVNVGEISGGGALNVVPDLAQCRFNVRLKEVDDGVWLTATIQAILAKISKEHEVELTLGGSFSRPPKPMTPDLEKLFKLAFKCGAELGLSMSANPTGGCCDGNNLAATGLPNIDTLGVRGGNIHSDREFMIPESLVERSQLSALILHKLATSEFSFFGEDRS